MTADESRAVIDLWQSERVEQTGLTDKPAVPDVAEGLDVSVEDVQRLLTEVRARRLEEQRQLDAVQELAEIQLAEEERKLAEVRRQRAELRREQAEAERRQVAQLVKTLPARQFVPVDLPPRYKRDANDAGVKLGGLVVGFVLVVMLYSGLGKHNSLFGLSSPRIHVTLAGATYNAQGKVDTLNIACANDANEQAPCGDLILTSERAHFQQTHDKEVADAAKAAALKVAQKNHDPKTYR